MFSVVQYTVDCWVMGSAVLSQYSDLTNQTDEQTDTALCARASRGKSRRYAGVCAVVVRRRRRRRVRSAQRMTAAQRRPPSNPSVLTTDNQTSQLDEPSINTVIYAIKYVASARYRPP